MFGRKKKDPQAEIDRLRKAAEAELAEAIKNKDKMTPQQQDELKSMIAAAAIATSSMRAAQTIQKADKMHEQTMKMIEDAHDMTKNAQGRGKIDPQKLIDASERLQKMIEKENAERDERLKKLEETSKKLKASSDELVKAAEQMQADMKEKAMGRAREQQSEADWRKQGCPVTKPVTVRKPIKLKKHAA